MNDLDWRRDRTWATLASCSRFTLIFYDFCRCFYLQLFFSFTRLLFPCIVFCKSRLYYSFVSSFSSFFLSLSFLLFLLFLLLFLLLEYSDRSELEAGRDKKGHGLIGFERRSRLLGFGVEVFVRVEDLGEKRKGVKDQRVEFFSPRLARAVVPAFFDVHNHLFL